MDFELSPDQQLLMTSLDTLLAPFRTPPHGIHGYVQYSDELQRELSLSGFLGIACEEGYGPLESALLIEEIATCPVSVEAAFTALVGPLLDEVEAPLVIAHGLGGPVRYLPHAGSICLVDGEDVSVGAVTGDNVEAIESVVAYPLARLHGPPPGMRRLDPALAQAVIRRVRIGIAVEAAGLMRGALSATAQYVKDRQQFGRPLADFQAIRHRLAEDAQIARATKLLALQAAYADSDVTAATACFYAQESVRKIIYDCHQFTGALGLTLEYPLHLWTYRLKFLQGEMGGRGHQAEALSKHIPWEFVGK